MTGEKRRPTRLRDLLDRSRAGKPSTGPGSHPSSEQSHAVDDGGKDQAGVSPSREAINQTFSLEELRMMPLSPSLDKNLDTLRQVLKDSPGIQFREFLIAGEARAALVFSEGMVDRTLVSNNILRPLMHFARRPPDLLVGDMVDAVKAITITTVPIGETRTVGGFITEVLAGGVGLLLDGQVRALTVDVTGFPTRSVAEPTTETVLRGPRDGFNESLMQNLALVKRRLKTPNLAVETISVGRETATKVAVLYIKGLTNPEHLAELRKRLQRVDTSIDGVLESNYIEELIVDNPRSPFPQMLSTERPDRVAAALLEGRIAILTDNTPFGLIIPAEFVLHMQSAEDYYQDYWFASAIRILRYVALVISLIGPAIYVSVTTFHQEMIPETLLFQIVAAREGVPFPAVIEMLLLDYSWELLREAGIRLPRPLGSVIAIVGALVVGQAAIQAGLTSPLAVIIVAITGIASFIAPSFALSFSLRVLRFPLTILGGILGLYGVVAGSLVLVIHLCGLRTLGLPYLAGFSPMHASSQKDAVLRVPWWGMRKRPAELAKRNRQRTTNGLKPGPNSSQ